MRRRGECSKSAPLSVPSNRCEQHMDRGAMSYVQRMPVGVAGLISPWNLPLYLLTFKIAPCIAFGCTCVCKPSEMTSLTAFMLCEVFVEAGERRWVVRASVAKYGDLLL